MPNTNILKINPDFINNEILETAAAILKDGGFVISPTETRYGLLCRADKMDIVHKLYNLKKRDYNLPCAIFVKSLNDIGNYGYFDDVSKKLAKSFLPGPLTLVLKDKSGLDKPLVIENKIGIRFSSSNVISGILQIINLPLTATSANLSGEKEFDTISELEDVFGLDIDLYLDSGTLNSLTSTVVECVDNKFRVLRTGAINVEKIENYLGGTG